MATTVAAACGIVYYGFKWYTEVKPQMLQQEANMFEELFKEGEARDPNVQKPYDSSSVPLPL